MEQHYYKLIEDYFNKNISNEDLADLMNWVEFSDENQHAFREVLKTYESVGDFFQNPKQQQKSWTTIQQHILKNQNEATVSEKKSFKLGWLKFVAAIVIISSISLLYINSQKHELKEEIVYNEIYNPKGQKRLVTMPDGSNIYLNGDSKIKYAQNFNAKKRIVYLEGEAFFDVQHLKNQPFIVYTGKASTTVLGTSFNINSYKSSKNLSITVQTGKVGVVVKNGKEKQVQFLYPNQQLNISKDDLVITKKNVDATEIDSWREYKMVFYDKPLSEIIEVIEREYDIDISLERESLKDIKLTTKFDKSSVTQVMDVIAQLSSAKYKIYEKKVIIY